MGSFQNQSNGLEALDILNILSLGLAIDNAMQLKKQVDNNVLYEQNLEIIERLERLENARFNKSRWNL